MFYDLRPAFVWTDGACRNQGLCEIRMAGWGLFFGFGHPCNFAVPLPGLEQTSILAELDAVAYIIHHSFWDITIFCDCQFVVSIVQLCIKYPDIELPFQDHLQRLEALQRDVAANPQRIRIFKVKGHDKLQSAQLDANVSLGHIIANHAVDKLAVQGANIHLWDANNDDRFFKETQKPD